MQISEAMGGVSGSLEFGRPVLGDSVQKYVSSCDEDSGDSDPNSAGLTRTLNLCVQAFQLSMNWSQGNNFKREGCPAGSECFLNELWDGQRKTDE